jgi:hypothetical protein
MNASGSGSVFPILPSLYLGWKEWEDKINTEFKSVTFNLDLKTNVEALSTRQPEIENPKALCEKAKFIATPYIAWDINDEPILAYFPSSLSQQVFDETDRQLKAFSDTNACQKHLKTSGDYRHPDDDSETAKSAKSVYNGKYGTLYLGIWHELGHERTDAPLVTANMVSGSKTFSKCGRLLESLGGLTTELSMMFGAFNLESCLGAMENFEKLCKSMPIETRATKTCAWEAWTSRAFLFNVQTGPHQDVKDDPSSYAAITTFGEFTGGDLVIPQLGGGLKFRLQPRDVIFIKGRLVHFVSPWEPKGEKGRRFSVVHFNHESVTNWVQDRDDKVT